jgi:aspartyl-tRNA(Asn)/glutamyl-tRNA(Gln) amidotransferase subunit C
MSAITVDDVYYVASLAKIAITPEEAERFTKELDAILGYVRQLDAVDTKGLEPTYQVTGLTNVTRPDELIDYGTTQKDLLKNAPRQKGGALEVPKVL